MANLMFYFMVWNTESKMCSLIAEAVQRITAMVTVNSDSLAGNRGKCILFEQNISLLEILQRYNVPSFLLSRPVQK